MDALAGIVDGASTDENQARFSRSSNTMSLIASNDVLRAMIRYRDEIKISNPNKTSERHDKFLSQLVWEIRKDLKDPPTKSANDFVVKLWASGPPENR